jgi:hypothetical protein
VSSINSNVYAIEMTGTGSKVTNCNVIGDTANNYCILMQGAFDDTPHTIVNSSASGCFVGFFTNEGAVRIESSSAFDNSFGVYLHSTESQALSDVASRNNIYNIYIDNATVVEMTNVTACNADFSDIYNSGGTVSSSLLTCDQAKVAIELGGNNITCDKRCP